MTSKNRVRRALLGLGFGGAVLLVLSAFAIDRALGQDVLLIVPHDSATVELNRGLFQPGDLVADVYGNPLREPVRVILPAAQRLIRPPEDPDLVLLPVDKAAGENPLQARTLWFAFRFAVPAALLLGVIGLFLPRGRTVAA